MRTRGTWGLLAVMTLSLGPAVAVAAQEREPTTRQAAIEEQQADKVPDLHAFVPDRGEQLMNKAGDLLSKGLPWRPYFESAYAGGGFPLGLAHTQHVTPYSFLDMRGSYSVAGYKLAEVEFVSPHLFHRRGSLSVLGGWREATQVGFFGAGNDTQEDDRTNYDFRQPYASATLTLQPTRRLWLLRGGVEWSQWAQRPGRGSVPSVETAYTPQTLPGLDATTTYLHSQGTVAFDWRTSSGYSRRGGFYGVTAHDYTDRDDAFGFRQVSYEAVQHVPILREAWVVSLHGLAETTFDKGDQQVPFFMLPALGGGSSLRGYSSWRFRDQNSLLLQAEWRIMANRFFETALFYDAGKVAARRSDLDLDGLKHDYGVGVRFHGPFATPLRVDVARSREGLAFVFSGSPVF